jgi:hypothetical protein
MTDRPSGLDVALDEIDDAFHDQIKQLTMTETTEMGRRALPDIQKNLRDIITNRNMMIELVKAARP